MHKAATTFAEKTHESSSESLEETITKVDQSTGEWHLNEHDIECIAVGAGIMGCGGGGNPYFGKVLAIRKLRAGKKIRVISAKRFKAIQTNASRAMPVAIMGAPTASPFVEKLLDTTCNSTAVEAMKILCSLSENENTAHKHTDIASVKEQGGVHLIPDFKHTGEMKNASGTRVTALLPAEIGGSNSMVPLVIASELGLLVIDCDTVGRAFPELQMCTTVIHGIPSYPAVLSDYNGRKCVCLYAESTKKLEDQFRTICVEMGSLGCLCLRPLSANEILEKAVLYSLSRAWRLGRMVLHSRKTKISPIKAILDFENGRLICTAQISDVERKKEDCFTQGEIKLEGLGDFSQQMYCISFQNENLLVKDIKPDGQINILATVPDLITAVDLESGEPIPTEAICFGLRVAVLVLPAPPMLRTQESIAVVGPKAFGFNNVAYQPIGEYSEHGSIPA